MRVQVKPTKTEKILLAVTAAFICLLLGLMLYGKATGAQGHYAVTTEKSAAVSSASASSVPADDEVPVNINTASEKELASLPGIGETLAGRIVDYRNEHGAFPPRRKFRRSVGLGRKYSRRSQIVSPWEDRSRI